MKQTSLRLRLFLVLLLATGTVWLCAVGWIYLSSRRQVEHVLDTRLQEAARMVSSLIAAMPATAPLGSAGVPGGPPGALGSYERQLSCQIWSVDGRMVARSSGAPEQRLTDQASGFSEREVDGELWRVFAVEDAAKGVRVLVGDRIGLRDRLIADLVKGLLWPALLIIPALGALIWLSVGRGLRPLRLMARDLSSREADDMRPIAVESAPREILPLVQALNGLFLKVDAARRHERDLTAFAAHELRTPLAGLKTQAQVALVAADPEIIKGALRQIIGAVDRTSRLVRQLLDIARLDATSGELPVGELAVGPLVAETVSAVKTPPGVDVVVDPALEGLKVRANRECLQLAIRNLHENAVQHTTTGTVEWSVAGDGQAILVRDTGPGVPAEELPQVTTRFYRGRNKAPSGSGLGLAIVDMAVRRCGATLHLRNRDDAPGLQAEIRFT
ncbi:ATP-binding protein [Enterovirga sp. CN4-39]|uniref:sensor histidine kinase n=1 Tax=Enterovirga sp. CN4-39 TaxID=3400910 RepID=UPI003BFC03A1